MTMTNLDPRELMNGEFLRDEMPFEQDFMQVRNLWVRDPAIAGAPLSIFLFLLSHQRGFRVTQQDVVAQLGMSRDRVLAARRKLEEAGYLETISMRYPKGARTTEGKSIAGHRMNVFRLKDPFAGLHQRVGTVQEARALLAAAETPAPQQPLASAPAAPAEPVENLPAPGSGEGCGKTSLENPTRHEARQHAAGASSENPTRLPQASTEKPALVFPSPIRRPRSRRPDDDDDARGAREASSGSSTTSVPELDPPAPAGSPELAVELARVRPVVLPDGDADRLQREHGIEPGALLRELQDRLGYVPLVRLLAVAASVFARHTAAHDPAAYLAAVIAQAPQRYLRRFPAYEPEDLDPPATAPEPTTDPCPPGQHRLVSRQGAVSCAICGRDESEVTEAERAAEKAVCGLSGHIPGDPTPREMFGIPAGSVFCQRCSELLEQPDVDRRPA